MVSLEYEMKIEKFEHDIKDGKKLNKKLRILFSNEYDEILGDILNLKDELFIDQVKEGVSLLLEDHYTDSCLSDERLSLLLEDNINEIKCKYKHDYALINKAWTGYDKISKRRTNNGSLLIGFRKHCIYTDERASHNCCSNENNGERICHFIIVNDPDSKKGIKFVVCEKCKKVYYSSFILARCYKCNVDYYTSLLSKDENPELLLATWENYHCPQFINEKMKCIKCHEYFYINMKTGLLTCLNKKCEFISKPKRILWTCSVCKEEFICGAIPYNPLDAEVTRRLVSQTILLKHKAHPNKMPCCKLNVYFTDFYHKQNCRGLLYESELDDNTIIVCEKCKAINYYDRFQWTCPKCGKRFKDIMISNSNENSEIAINSIKERKSDKKERDKKEIELNVEEKENKKTNTHIERKSEKKEKENIENKKIMTPKPIQYISKRLGVKKEHELKDFKLNNEKDNIREEDDENEKKKSENIKKFDSGRKYRRFHFNSIGMNEEDKDKDKNEEKNKNLEKEKEKEKNDCNNNFEEENEENNYRKNRSRTTYNKVGKKEEQKRVFRRFRFERDNKDKVIEEKGEEKIEKKEITEEKEKSEDKEKTEEKEKKEDISPRLQWRKRYKRDAPPIKKESSKEINKDIEKEEKDKKELEEKEKKAFEEKERKEKEEKERKEKEETERKEKKEKESELKYRSKEDNLGGRGWFRRLAAGKEKESTNKSSKKESTNKSAKKEKDLTTENEEESEEDNYSIDNKEEDNNELINFGDNESSSEEDEKENEKEEKENPIEPDSILMNFKFKRSQNKRKTRGMELADEQDDNREEEKSKKIIKKKKNVPQIKIAMSQIPGISEHLFNHIQKRMSSILNRCKIPIFNIEDYTFNKKLGEGSYAVIFSVYKNDDKERKHLALKKIIAKTLTEIDKFTKEFELVHSCAHQNIMKIYGICIRMLDQTTYSLYVLMELSYCDWDKEIKMHLMKNKSYTEKELINILRQLTGALLFMQQNLKISHRDIKPQNVLLFGEGLYKIADFGEAKEAKLSKQVNTLRGTELYMSPALYSGLKNDRNDVNHDPYKSDVFSLGFCFLYASTLNFNILYQVREIYNSNRMNDILHQQLNKKYSQTFISILSHMMETDEACRFDFPHLVAFIDENYDKDGNLKIPEKIDEKMSETINRSINRKHK